MPMALQLTCSDDGVHEERNAISSMPRDDRSRPSASREWWASPLRQAESSCSVASPFSPSDIRASQRAEQYQTMKLCRLAPGFANPGCNVLLKML